VDGPAPEARTHAGVSHDSARHETVVVSGQGTGDFYLDDMWILRR
jgi:hypothetical protein